MKKFKIFAALLLVYSTFSLSGQKIVLELDMKGGKAQEVYSTKDQYGNIAYIFQGTKSIQITLLDVEYKITKEFLISRNEADKKNQIIGATLSTENIVVYLYDSKERNFASLVVDRNVGTFKFNPSIASHSKTEFLLKSFEMNQLFYLMIVPEHKSTLLLYASVEGAIATPKNYEIPFPMFYAKLSSGNELLNQKAETPIGIEKINYTIENNIKSSYPSKKMYTYSNKIYMTFEDPAHTHLIIIDPNATIAIYRKLNFTLDKGKNTTPKKGNSFLFKGDLFRVTMNNDQLNLIVVNLDSMEMLKSYNVFPDQPISFINGPIKEDGNGGESKILKSTQTYFKRLQRGNLSIAVNELSKDMYETEIGAYEEITSYRSPAPSMGGLPGGVNIGIGMGMGMGGFGMGGLSMGMGGMSMGYGGMGMGYGGMGYPGYYPYGGSSYNTTSIHVSYFQSLMKIEDLSHIEGVVPRTMRDKINEYEENVLRNNSPESLNILASYNGIVLGYYAKGRSKYNLVEFLK